MEQKHKVQIEVADPSALGLFGLAMVTLVASSQKMGLTEGIGFVLPWAIFLGSIAQLIACVYDFKHNNLFGATAFGGYGLFWIAVGTSWMIKAGTFGEGLASQVDPRQFGVAMVGYLIFSVILLGATLKIHKAMFSIIAMIIVLFISLALDSFGMGDIWHTIAAITEFAISMLGFYMCGGAFLNKFYGKVILPQGKPFIS
ncbi:MAG: acetate uptake transporter [Bacteroidales bacterium]